MDRLWDIVGRNSIYVAYKSLYKPPREINGLFVSSPDAGPIIILDHRLKNDNQRLLKCVLAEELGHFFTSPRTNILTVYKTTKIYGECNEQIIMAQDERKALRWATDFLMPDVELCRALSEGCRSCYDLAEWFHVTEWMVYRKLGFLKTCFRRTGLKVKGRELFRVALNEYIFCEGKS